MVCDISLIRCLELTPADSSVSKQRDPSRIVTSSAYLLFYRRRSDVPLGGPRFQQIIDNYDNPPESSEDELPDSGEDQSLDAKPSLHGSSSALIGVGAALRPANGSGSTGQMMTVNPHDLDGLPAYQAHEANDPDAAPIMSDAIMNEGVAVPSIEDEANGSNFTSIKKASWDFSRFAELDQNPNRNFVSGTGSEIDDNGKPPGIEFDVDGSDIVQDNSSACSSTRRGRMEDFDNAPAEFDEGVFLDDHPVPDLIDDGRMDTLDLHREFLLGQRSEFKIPAEQDDGFEEPATEIHVEEGEGLKLD
jgi:ubiquitin carboxyl-terminal hydrolase 4/11/15